MSYRIRQAASLTMASLVHFQGDPDGYDRVTSNALHRREDHLEKLLNRIQGGIYMHSPVKHAGFTLDSV